MDIKFKAVYQKMMDDLKDSGMWIEWANHLKESEPEEAEYLVKAAKDRLEDRYPESKEWFERVCDESGETGKCLKEVFVDDFDDWRDDLMKKIEKF